MAGKPKKQYFQVFRESYSQDFPCILKSSKGQKFAFCSTCRCDFNIAHGGRNDISNHVKCSKHVTNLQSVEQNKKISNFFSSSSSCSSESSVIRAECYFTSFLVEHNIPLNVSVHAGPLFRKMFPQSETAKRYGCGKTKTSAIVQEMAQETCRFVVESLQKVPFSIATDGSNDSDSKLYPIVTTYFDHSLQRMVSRLLSLPVLEGESTGRNIGDLILRELERLNVPVENLIAFSADNAPVMLGNKNGVVSVLKAKQESLITIGCPCHLINLAAEKAAATLPWRPNIDEVLIDVYYYLNRSAKRKEKLKVFQELYGVDTRKILKHVTTRWLSLGRCLPRFMEHWNPLLSFFKDEVTIQQKKPHPLVYTIPKNTSKPPVKRVLECSPRDKSNTEPSVKRKPATPSSSSSNSRPISLVTSAPEVTKINQTQLSTFDCPRTEPSSGRHKIKPVVSVLCGKRKKANVSSTLVKVKNASGNASVCDKRIVLKNQNSNLSREEKLVLYLSSSSNKAFCLFLLNSIPVFDKVNIILQSSSPQVHILHDLLSGLLQELFSKFLKPVVVKNVPLLEINYHCIENQREDTEIVIGCQTSEIVTSSLSGAEKTVFFSSVRKYFMTACDYIINKFPLKNVTLQKAKVASLDKIENAVFSDVIFFTDMFPFLLPVKENETRHAATDELHSQFTALQLENISSIVNSSDSIDAKWATVGHLRSVDGCMKYDRLTQVMLAILTIPHGNAECERVFSLVTKNKTKFRSQLSDKSVEAISMVKCNRSNSCYEQDFSESFLVKAKKATAASLNKTK